MDTSGAKDLSFAPLVCMSDCLDSYQIALRWACSFLYFLRFLIPDLLLELDLSGRDCSLGCTRDLDHMLGPDKPASVDLLVPDEVSGIEASVISSIRYCCSRRASRTNFLKLFEKMSVPFGVR